MARRQAEAAETSAEPVIAACKAGMRYRHEWIIMEVTGRDQHDCPTGHVLFHSSDPEEASAAFARISKEKPRHLFEFYGVKWVFSGKQLEQKGRELAEGINRALKEMRDAG